MDPRRADSLAWQIIRVSGVLLVIALLMSVIKVPYAIEAPGPVSDTLGSRGEGESAAQVVTVTGAKSYPTDGNLYFTTVSVNGSPDEHINVWEWIGGHLDDDAIVVPEERVFGTGNSQQEIREINAAEMQGSQKSAIAVALRSTGHDVGQDNVVASIVEDYPADGKLELKDKILAVDGKRQERVSDLVAAISDRGVGDTVELTVDRGGVERQVRLRAEDIGNGRAGIGIGIEPIYDYPVEVRIDAGNVGGPSAGAMFALAIHDVLTPGELTGGKSLAGTGTINDGGAIGPIGGIRQKMVGAREAQAEYFLAPADNCDEVVGHVPEGLTVLEVADFESAVDAVEAAATGDVAGLPSCGTR